MKKLFTFILCAVFAIAARAQFSGSGSGTVSDPYLIFNPTQLAQMANFLNNPDVVFELKNDINLTEFISDNYPAEGWAPVGVLSSPFKGTLKGNGRTISGLSINRPSTEYVGLFGYADGARISELNILATTIKGGNHTGSLVGYANNATLNTITVTISKGISGTNYVGGLASHAESTTANNINVDVQGTGVKGTDNVGGIFGQNSGTCKNATVVAEVSGRAYVGGAVGSTSANFTSCIATGNVTGTSTSISGFAGNASNSVFSTCEHIGDVKGAGRVGGVCGNSESAPTFTNCKSKGTITSTADYTGGILGYGDFISMTNCSHFGDISGINYVGGVYGGNPPQTQEDYPVYYLSTVSGSNNNTHTWTNTTNFTQGNVNTRTINKCTAIGNILGEEKIGGLVGSHEAGRTFRFSSYSNSAISGSMGGCTNHDHYSLWRGNNCIWQVYYSGSAYRYFTPVDYIDYTSLNVSNSYYSGNISGTENVGGLIGYKISGEMKNCYAYANVVGETNVGGLIGSIKGMSSKSSYDANSSLTIKSSAAINTTVNATKNNVGRIYGYKADDYVTIGALGTADGNLSLNRTNVVKSGVVQTITDDLQNGTSIGQSMLKLKATFVAKGWNFDNDWTMQETESYPYMRYQAAPPVIESNLVSQATNVSGKSINGGTVYLYYKDHDPMSQDCNESHNWNFSTVPLQSGAEVRLYADAEGLTPSYFTTTTVAYPGSGTEEDPYLIFSAEDLQGVSKQGYYKLKNDIDLTAWIAENSPNKGWVSIGRNGTEATYIDGDGHKITGLWTNTTDDYTGLFSNFSRGSIKNLTVEVATGKQVKGGNYTGILIGRNANGLIQNVTIKGSVQGSEYVGGVMGYSDNNTINAVTFDGAISSTTNSARLGGLAGAAASNMVSSSRMNTKISASGSSTYAGGLFGAATGSVTKTIANCNIATTGADNYVGGIMGNGSTEVSQSLTTGTVSATGSGSYAGGLVAYATGAINDCYSTAKTTGYLYTGGLVGYSTSTINHCYAKGDANGVNNGAGIVAQLDGSSAGVTNCVAVNEQLTFTAQSSWASRVIGGYKNGAKDPEMNNYALNTMQVTLNGVATKKYDDLVEGIAKTEAELKSTDTYLGLGWDMNDVWGIDEGELYPYLLWEYDANPVVEITLDKTVVVIAVGNTLALTAAIQPLGATNKRLTWTSSKPAVATVEDGVVTAVSVGEAVITATTTDGSNLSATCTVTVVANHDAAIQELQTLVDEAQALYDNSTEGDNIGQYAPGSRAALLSVIKSVKAKISSTMSESEITECTTQLTNAITDFKSKRVTGGADTDLTAYDDIVYIEGFESAPGQQHALSVQLNNVKSLTGFQCDLYLPEGASVVYDDYGYADATLNEARANSKVMSLDAEPQSDGSLRLLAYSQKNIAFTGNEGEVAQVNVMLSETLEDGEHPLILKNIVLTEASGQTIEIDYVKTTLTITSYMLGDANGDLKVNVGDLAATASHILGNTPDSFVEKAADANEDGKINVGDLAKIAGIILGTANQAPQHVAASTGSSDADMTGTFDASMSIEPLSDHEYMLHIGVENLGFSFSGFQFDLQLPAGLGVVTDEYGYVDAVLNAERTNARNTDIFDAACLQDGSLRVLCASTHNMMFADEQGEVLAIRLLADESFEGNGLLALTHICYTATGEGLEAADVMMSFADAITSIQNVMNHDEDFVWDLNGRMVGTTSDIDALPMGIYMINGKKIVK